MYIYTPLGWYWITLYEYVLGFIMPHVNIQLEDNKQYISNTPHIPMSVIGMIGMMSYLPWWPPWQKWLWSSAQIFISFLSERFQKLFSILPVVSVNMLFECVGT